MTLSALAQHTKERLDATCVKYAGEPEGIIRRLAVACGSGRTAFPSALAAGAQAVITGEASYDSALTFGRMGLSILEAGHFDTEKWFMDSMASRLQNELGRLQYNVRIHISKVSKDVYSGEMCIRDSLKGRIVLGDVLILHSAGGLLQQHVLQLGFEIRKAGIA